MIGRPLINNLREIRADGRVIDEGMSIEQVAALGSPSKITRVQWSADGMRHELDAYDGGYLVKVLPDRTGLIVMGRDRTELRILNGDGSLRVAVKAQFGLNGISYSGRFSWHEPPRSQAAGTIGAVVGTNTSLFLLDINSETGEILAAYETR